MYHRLSCILYITSVIVYSHQINNFKDIIQSSSLVCVDGIIIIMRRVVIQEYQVRYSSL